VPVFLTIPNYFAMTIVAKIAIDNSTSPVDAAGSNHSSSINIISSNVTTYHVGFSDLAEANERLLYRINIWLYSFVLKVVPCFVLTFFTGFLIQGRNSPNS
jgi:type IV secretory pathway component VirB8